jgi:hypothetical protein
MARFNATVSITSGAFVNGFVSAGDGEGAESRGLAKAGPDRAKLASATNIKERTGLLFIALSPIGIPSQSY